jgi:hypothetical protein
MIHKSLFSLIVTLNKATCDGKLIEDPKDNFIYQHHVHWKIEDFSKIPSKIESHFIYRKTVNDTYSDLPKILQFDKDLVEPSDLSKWIKENSTIINKVIKNGAFI